MDTRRVAECRVENGFHDHPPVGLAMSQTLHKANNGCCRCLSDFSSAMCAVAIGRAPTLGSALCCPFPSARAERTGVASTISRGNVR
jgi:hypothetical protein